MGWLIKKLKQPVIIKVQNGLAWLTVASKELILTHLSKRPAFGIINVSQFWNHHNTELWMRLFSFSLLVLCRKWSNVYLCCAKSEAKSASEIGDSNKLEDTPKWFFQTCTLPWMANSFLECTRAWAAAGQCTHLLQLHQWLHGHLQTLQDSSRNFLQRNSKCSHKRTACMRRVWPQPKIMLVRSTVCRQRTHRCSLARQLPNIPDHDQRVLDFDFSGWSPSGSPGCQQRQDWGLQRNELQTLKNHTNVGPTSTWYGC